MQTTRDRQNKTTNQLHQNKDLTDKFNMEREKDNQSWAQGNPNNIKGKPWT